MTKKRVRNVPINIWVRPDELDTIQERMAEAGIRNMSAYIRKMALDGYFLEMDTSPVKESNRLLRSISNNFNQVARLANSTGNVYETDLADMAQKLNRLWDMQTRLMEKILQTK